MTLQLEYEKLKSLAIREAVGNGGIRKLDLKAGAIVAKNPQTGWFGTVIDWGKKFVGFVLGALKWIGVSFQSAWGWLMSVKRTLMNFDWNMSDAAIDKAIAQKWVQFGGVLGGFAGQIVGWGVSAGATKAILGTINPMLAVAVTTSLKREAVEELFGELNGFLRQSANLAMGAFFLWAYKGLRWVSDKMGERMGIPKPDRSKPNILSQEFTKARIKIFGDDDTFLGNFAEEFFEELDESITEAGFVVANELDSYYAQKSQGNYIVELKPERESDEVLKLAGTHDQLESAIPQVLNNIQVIGNRDIGIVTGLDDTDLQAKVKPSEIIITITWYNKPKPPYTDKAVKIASLGEKLIKREYSICDVNRSKLDWNTIKIASGGSNGFTTGETLCRARLNNGRRMMCLGGSQGEAQQIVESLCQLTNAEILYPVSFTERRDFSRSKAQIKRRDSVKMYPAYMVIQTQNLISPNNNSFGNKYKAGQYLKRKARVPLYTDKRPHDWDTILKNLFKLTDETD